MNLKSQEMKLRKVIDTLNIQEFALYLFIKYQREGFQNYSNFSEHFSHIYSNYLLMPKIESFCFLLSLITSSFGTSIISVYGRYFPHPRHSFPSF